MRSDHSLKATIADLRTSGATSADVASYIYRDKRIYPGGADPEVVASICQRIARELQVPLEDVWITGSSKIGFSLLHGGGFARGDSDLDVAIVNSELAKSFLESASAVTRGFKDVTPFPALLALGSRTAFQAKQRFSEQTRIGAINPAYMPACEARGAIEALTRELSEEFSSEFVEVSIMIYAAQGAFLQSQARKVEAGWKRGDAVPLQSTNAISENIANSLYGVDLTGQDLPFLDSDVLAALQQVNEVVAVQCAIIFPLGSIGTYKRCHDIFISYMPREDVHDYANRLWLVGSRWGRRNISFRFISSQVGVAQLLQSATSHSMMLVRDFGDCAWSKRVILDCT